MDADRSRLTESEKEEVAHLASELNAIKARGDAAIDNRQKELAWKIHDEWQGKYRELVAVKRRIRSRLAGL